MWLGSGELEGRGRRVTKVPFEEDGLEIGLEGGSKVEGL